MERKDDLIQEPLDLEKEKLLPPKETEEDVKSLSMRDIRALAFHFVYAAEQLDYDTSLESIVDNFRRGFDLEISDKSKAVELARGTIEDRAQLDDTIKPFLKNWDLKRLGICTHLILRMATWELNQPDSIANIVINEAVELAKAFAEKDAYKFVNGVLDQMIEKQTPEEVKED